MADNSAAGSQPGPLPIVHRVQPVNVPNGVPRFETERPGLPDRIIYHSTVSNSATGSSVGWLSTHPTSGVSVHTVANRDGSLTEICPPLYRAYHAGYCLPGWSNRSALGIEVENSSDGAQRIEPYADAQVGAAAYRVATWAFSFGIPLERIKAHKDVAVYPTGPNAGQLGRKIDPAGPWPDARFRALVSAWLLFFRNLPAASVPHYVEGAPAPAPAKEYGFLGASTISLAVFTRVLQDRHSPILGEFTPDLYYNLCVEKGINPAVALAFFVHETNAGADPNSVIVQYNLKNWGAVRSAERPALAAQDSPVMTPLGPFAAYNTWLGSLRDWCLRILGPKYLQSHPDWTVRQALEIYAPTSDPAGGNKPEAYNAAVQAMCKLWEQQSAG